jgi:beta-lactamase class A
MRLSYFLLKLFFALAILYGCQSKKVNPLEQILKEPSSELSSVLQFIENHEVQILYTRIFRDSMGLPSFQEHSFQLDSKQYFYPASTVKLPIAILALQKLNELQANGIPINQETRLQIFDPESQEVILKDDSTSEDGYPSISHLIKKIFLVSDNDAYNYLFDFLGRDYINKQLKKKGINQAYISHKFLLDADNDRTWEFKFYDKNNNLVYEQKSIASTMKRPDFLLSGLKKGTGFTDGENNLRKEPFDFSSKNYFSIQALQQVLISIIFPEAIAPSSRFDLNPSQYEFLRYWMSRTPAESQYPKYDRREYYDSYVKFLMFGDSKEPIPEQIRIYNKVGEAYGTLTDVAYIVDSEKKIEFMLTATILVNENHIYNDGVYEYDSLGYPFLAELGRKVYQFELEE